MEKNKREQTSSYFQQNLAEQVWRDTYKWEVDGDFSDTCRRVAKAIASVEKDNKIRWEETFYDLLFSKKYVPAGRVWSNAGTGLENTTLINCFVSGFSGPDQDSIKGIYEELKRQAKILASEGGYGVNFSILRPRGSYVAGIGVETSGVVEFMNLWDTSSTTLTKGSGFRRNKKKGKGKIRKGAMMGMMDIWHPAINEFIQVKSQPGVLSKFNLTVLLNNKFMNAVKNHEPWILQFPDTDFPKYKKEWNGNLYDWQAKGYPVIDWTTYEDANELWDLITKTTYNRNEPGIAFIDRVNEYNNLSYCENINASNPCFTGETIIAVADGRNGISIKQLAEENKKFQVYSGKIKRSYGTSSRWKSEIKEATAFKTGNKKVIEVFLSNGSSFKCTPDHLLARPDGSYIEASNSLGETLEKFYTFSNKMTEASYRAINSKTNGYTKQYRLMWEYLNGPYDGTKFNIDHIDGESTNDSYENLQLISIEEHKEKTKEFRVGNNPASKMKDKERFNLLQRQKNILGNAKRYNWAEDRIEAELSKLPELKPVEDVNCYMDESVYVQDIKDRETEDVYDITVEDNHNFYIITKSDDDRFLNSSGVLVHNCGEQFLPINGSCNLGSINLVKYVKNGKWDYKALANDTYIMVRMQDNINDLTNFPLPEQKEEARSKRRVGIGYMGYASALYLLKQRYGSETSLKDTAKLLSFITNKLYMASTRLAEEKGPFPLFETDKYLESKFVKNALTKETKQHIQEFGIRNSHLTTVAPTGNSSIFTDIVSGGLEPVISPSYVRTLIVSEAPEGLTQPTVINWDKHTYEVANGWEWVKEGDEHLLKKTFEGLVYKIDKGRGLTKEETVYDYAVLNMDDFDPEADYAVNLFNLTVKDHVDVMNVFQKYVDSSISKTVNLPNDYPFEDFKSVYMDAYDTGYIKGMTTYRWGTMTSVISSKDDKQDESIEVRKAPERPESLPCHVYKITVKGEKWVVFVGLLDEYPYEVFAGKIDAVDIPSKIIEGHLLKQKRGVYSFEVDGDIIVKNVIDIFSNEEQEALTRMISTTLRHGVPVDFIYEQLNKSKGSIADFNKAITRALKKYMNKRELAEKCPICSAKLTMIEGCKTCTNCGYGACG